MLRKVIVIGILALAGSIGAPGLALDSSPVGISCTVLDMEGQVSFGFSRTSNGPWVNYEQIIRRGGERFKLGTEGTSRDARGVIYMKNMETDDSDTWYGPASTRESYSLEFENWFILCMHWPYVAG